MKILVVNDDGIQAKGIYHLAKLASEIGQVWLIAPDDQCSAMSHGITVHGGIDVKPVDFPVNDVTAYKLCGTPADCVKLGINSLMPNKPDMVFSGINYGYNVGFDILYSGTVGAAMEALLHGVPAMAFSMDKNDNYELVEAHLLPLIKKLINSTIEKNQIWNINIPACGLKDFKGILENRVPEQASFHIDNYNREEKEDGSLHLTSKEIWNSKPAEGTDMKALLDNYISVGNVTNNVLKS